MSKPSAPSTRELNRLATRKKLANAAVSLFVERGYESVTMDDVAGAAGVSRRTAFRYFATKGDLAMEMPREWMALFDAAMDESAPEERELVDRVKRASFDVADRIDADPDPVRQLMSLASAHPDLALSYARSSQDWVDHLEARLASDSSLGPAVTRTVAAVTMAMIDASLSNWSQGDAGALRPIVASGFELIRSVFEPFD